MGLKRYLMAVLLVVCLVLSSCRNQEESSPVSAGESDLAAAAGVEETAVLLTVDGREIPAWRYLYWLGYTCQRIEERYRESELELDWSTPVAGGTLADYAKDQALADTALYATVENWAEQYGCTAAEIAGTAASTLPELGLSAEQMEELQQTGRLYRELYTLFCTESSALAPTQEELRKFGEEQGAVTVDRILIPFGEDREAAQRRAAEVFSLINGAANQAETFSALTAELGGVSAPKTVLPGDGQLAEELMEAAQALGEGQCSGILETEKGFALLLKLPLETAALQEACFDHRLQSAAESSEVTVTEEYSALDAADFAGRFLAQPAGDRGEQT
jgi:hypothetical protein